LKIELERLPNLRWNEFLSPKQGALIELEAESLAPTDLYNYAQDLRARGQNADRYELTFWRKINIPFAILAMVMISLPLVFGTRERSGIGARVLFGAGIGVLFYLVDQVLAQLGLLTELNPAVTATAPALTLFLIALVLVRWVR
jgi:lipopolysaccharide export system permease protein